MFVTSENDGYIRLFYHILKYDSQILMTTITKLSLFENCVFFDDRSLKFDRINFSMNSSSPSINDWFVHKSILNI